MLSPTYEITTALSHTDELISPPYDIAIVTISYGRVTMSSVWDSMMSKKNMGWPFYAAVVSYGDVVSRKTNRSALSCNFSSLLYPPNNEVVGGYIGFTPSVRPSVCLSVCPSVRPSRLPCPLCNMYSSGWILSILATNDHYHERVCRTQWPLTLTYIFKVIWPWLRKSCPLCSVYSSGWILFIFSTNDHYH